MKFTIAIVSALAAVATASPFSSTNATSTNATSTLPPVSTITPQIPYVVTTSTELPVATLSPVVAAPSLPNVPGVLFCDNIVACIEELADVVSTCAAALAAECMDIVQDVKCLVDAGEMITKVPKACKGCLKL